MDQESDLYDKKNSKNRVKVAIRVRPMISKQLINSEQSCVQFPSKDQIVLGERAYKFDRVFRQTATQREVYQDCIKELIMGCFDGYNAAVLAYGQTGSGKTYTMGTNSTAMECNQQGIIPKVIQDLFTQIQKRKDSAQFIIKATFLQIYNEQILDLLEDSKNMKLKQNGVSIREEKDGSISIYGVTEEEVNNRQQMFHLLDKGSLKRTTAATMMNQTSSRSHAIFTIFLEQHPFDQQDDGFITAKFFFVDLAGSQRLKKTGATGTTLKEGININLGLLELGNVISALAFQKKQSQFITYRNSKLTRILQDSLGGNSNTYMIACISPAQSNYQQSTNTLKYASKAMNIKNKPVVNRDPHSALLNTLRQRIAQLEHQNQKLKQVLQGQGVNMELLQEQIFKTCQQVKRSKSIYDEQNRKSSNVQQFRRNQQEFKRLQLKLDVLQRKNDRLLIQLKQQKKRKNQLQIAKYEVTREKDILSCMMEQITTNHPQIHLDMQRSFQKHNIPLIENYLTKIQQFQSQLFEKQKINTQLEIQYAKLKQMYERDQQILIKKNSQIYQLSKQNKQNTQVIAGLKKQIYKLNNIQYEPESSDQEAAHSSVVDEPALQADQSFNNELCHYTMKSQKMHNQLKNMEKKINQREEYLNELTNDQIELEYKLIEQMKQQYHQKIAQLQRQKKNLIKQQRNEVNSINANKFSIKIDSLEQELRQFRQRAKEQKQMEQKIKQQTSVIKNLDSQIKNFKVQKIELNRKIKQDKQVFQKFKNKRTQELYIARKQNIKKQIQIKKLANDNKKKQINFMKKNDELKKVKKINQTLKQLMKPLKKNQRHSTRSEFQNEKSSNQQLIKNSEIDRIVENSLRSMLLKINRDYEIEKYSSKCSEMDKQLEVLVREQSNLHLQMQRLQLQEDYQQPNYSLLINSRGSQVILNLNELTERINNIQENRTFCMKKYEQLLRDEQKKYQFCIESEVIYNPSYDNINVMRQILKAFLKSCQNILKDNYDIKIDNQQAKIKIGALQIEIEENKQSMLKINMENQENLARLREQMMFRMYQNSIEECSEGIEAQKGMTNLSKIGEKEKKAYQRKIIDLTKNNAKQSAEMQILRRKNNIIQEKYQSLRSLFDKDKFIGRPVRQQEHIHNNKEMKIKPVFNTTPAPYQTSKSLNHNSNLLEQLNSMNEKLKNFQNKQVRGVRKVLQFGEDVPEEDKEIPSYQRSLGLNKYKWQCVATIDAHNSPVLAVKNYQNLLISAATRNVKIWNLQTNQLSSELLSGHLNSFVRSLVVHKDKQLLAASCDKIVTLWDLRSSNSEGVLRGHKDEIRSMHIINNYLFTAGKGLSNSGGLLIWDLRYLNFNNPMQEKQRNQDIFSMTSSGNVLYYGTRDHHVRRLNIDTMQTLTTFQPPHMDTVTCLTICKDHLISGSKDKNLRLWCLDNSIYNLKSTVHAFNDYINTVQSTQVFNEGDPYHPIFFSGDRTGQIKVGAIVKEKIEFVGMMSHTQSVNSVCSLEYNKGVTATASSDKTIKLWQPTHETFHQIEQNLC